MELLLEMERLKDIVQKRPAVPRTQNASLTVIATYVVLSQDMQKDVIYFQQALYVMQMKLRQK